MIFWELDWLFIVRVKIYLRHCLWLKFQVLWKILGIHLDWTVNLHYILLWERSRWELLYHRLTSICFKCHMSCYSSLYFTQSPCKEDNGKSIVFQNGFLRSQKAVCRWLFYGSKHLRVDKALLETFIKGYGTLYCKTLKNWHWGLRKLSYSSVLIWRAFGLYPVQAQNLYSAVRRGW